MTISFQRAINDIQVIDEGGSERIELGIIRTCQIYLNKCNFLQKPFYRKSIAAARIIMDYVTELKGCVNRREVSDEHAAYLLFEKIFQQGSAGQDNPGIRVFSTDFGSMPSRLWIELADVMFREFSNLGNNILFYTFGNFCKIDAHPYHEYSAIPSYLASGEEDEDQGIIAEQKMRYNHMKHMIQHYIDQHLPTSEVLTIINPDGSRVLAVEELMLQNKKTLHWPPLRFGNRQ